MGIIKEVDRYQDLLKYMRREGYDGIFKVYVFSHSIQVFFHTFSSKLCNVRSIGCFTATNWRVHGWVCYILERK